MSQHRPYPTYKASSVSWIGRVPEHWETLRIKRAAQLRTERRNDAPDGQTYIGLEDVETESGRYAPTEGGSRQSDVSMVGVFHAGDVLYGKLRPYLRKAIVADRDGVCSTEFLVLRAGRVSASWLHRWLLTPDVTQQIEAGCDGAKMPRADWEHVGSIPVILPPAYEQMAIAAALDRETARIDALIAKKTRFIELLDKKRQTLISHAVTKGLNPEVRMRDSGVKWIGMVPEHWGVAPIKRWFSTTSGATPDTDQQSKYYVETDGIPWIRTTDLTNGPVTEFVVGITEHAIADTACKLIPSKAVLVAMYGGDGTIGKNGLLEIPACINQAICALLPNVHFIAEFTFAYVQFYRPHWMIYAASTRKDPNISQEIIRGVPIVCPPVEEQQRIVSFLTKALARVGELMAKTQHSIDLLKKRRSALITAAVTGQIDLRESA